MNKNQYEIIMNKICVYKRFMRTIPLNVLRDSLILIEIFFFYVCRLQYLSLLLGIFYGLVFSEGGRGGGVFQFMILCQE